MRTVFAPRRTISAASAARMFSAGMAPKSSVRVSRSLRMSQSVSFRRSMVVPEKVSTAAAPALRSFS